MVILFVREMYQRKLMTKKYRNLKKKRPIKNFNFNPGKPVEGIPFINNKLSIFDEGMMQYYNYSITSQRNEAGTECYVFSIKVKEGVKTGDVVLKEMITWFKKADFSIVARDYRLSTDNLVLILM